MLTIGKCLLLVTQGLLALSLGVCCPLVDSVRNQWKTPGDIVPTLTPGDLVVRSGLSNPIFCLQAAPPPISGTL